MSITARRATSTPVREAAFPWGKSARRATRAARTKRPLCFVARISAATPTAWTESLPIGPAVTPRPGALLAPGRQGLSGTRRTALPDMGNPNGRSGGSASQRFRAGSRALVCHTRRQTRVKHVGSPAISVKARRGQGVGVVRPGLLPSLTVTTKHAGEPTSLTHVCTQPWQRMTTGDRRPDGARTALPGTRPRPGSV